MKQSRRSRKSVAVALAASLWLTGCASGLEPVATTAEFTPPPAESPLWQAVADAQEKDWFAPLNRGSDALDWRLRAIDAATDSIELQTFLWDLDAVGHLILQHILAAADRGVQVRILLDDSFILNADQALLELDRHAGIELKVFNPYKRRASQAALREILNAGEFYRLDHRMHNKAMVVDNQVAVVGGRNLAREYFGYHPTGNFRDMEVVVGGGIVLGLAEGFDRYWNNPWSFPIEVLAAQRPAQGRDITIEPEDDARDHWHRELDEAGLQAQWVELATNAFSGNGRLLLDDPPGRDPNDKAGAPVQVGNSLIAAIDGATDEVWLISAYLIPTPELEDAVARAETRGTDVRILTNSIGSNNHLSAHSAYRNHLRELLSAGADIYEVRADAEDRQRYMASPVEDKGLGLHAKLLVFDDHSAYVGSANLDPRSLHINTEMGLLIESPELNRKLREHLTPDFLLRNAWQVMLEEDGRISWRSDDETLYHQPSDSTLIQLEDWVMSLVPLESEL